MFQVKICGITTPEDALAAVDAGADAIGLNFYPRSKRYVELAAAKEIANAIPAGVARVGVFVNASAKEIAGAVDALALDAVQLHGDESPEFVAKLPAEWFVVRAYRLDGGGVEKIAADLLRSDDLGRTPNAVLVDAHVDGQFGGTGVSVDWSALCQWRRKLLGKPLILAGGLTPKNVAEAVHAVKPTAVDTASGVETRTISQAPPRKDPQKVQQFVAAAREAFEIMKRSQE